MTAASLVCGHIAMTLVQLPIAHQSTGELALRRVHVRLGIAHRTDALPDRQFLHLRR